MPRWDELSEDCQLRLAREAMERACALVAAQADVLAAEFERGELADRGGAEALRLFARLIRLAPLHAHGVAGRA